MLDFLPVFWKEDFYQKTTLRRMVQHYLSFMGLGNLPYDQQSQAMTLFPGIAVTDHIVGSLLE